MLIRAMVRDVVDDDLKPAVVRLPDQSLGVFQRAEDGIDIAIVAHVVPKVLHWGRVKRRQPHRVNTQVDEVVEALDHTTQVARSIAVRILE